MHCKTSGVTDHYAVDDEHALYLARQVIQNINLPTSNSYRENIRLTSDASTTATVTNENFYEEPKYNTKEIYGIVGGNLTKTFDVREVIARIFDGSRFSEFKKMYGETLVCGYAR